MNRLNWFCFALIVLGALPAELPAQKPPYDQFPPANPPYYRVRYEASSRPGELIYPANYTIWIPEGVKVLRGVVVHQHGCGEGSCKSGLTGAYDLHWQALARKHGCALLSPAYEQPEKADCQKWCDPRNGSDAAFQKCLVDLSEKSGHPELARVPWALWGHSGGGHWAGGMVLLHPDRVAAAWLRSGVPLLKADPKSTSIKAQTLNAAALKVPVMCNLGAKEGVVNKEGRFAGVWKSNETFFNELRGKGGLACVAVDPLTEHECGNQRYFAIPWLDACLAARLPKSADDSLRDMPTEKAWLAPVLGNTAIEASKFTGDPLKANWLPSEAIARSWMQYVKDTVVTDVTPPPVPTSIRLQGNTLTWTAAADPESGLAGFIIERDGELLANLPENGKNPFGRPVFQNLQYSDTPTQPLVLMQFTDKTAVAGPKHRYRITAVNTAGLKSEANEVSSRTDSVSHSFLATGGEAFIVDLSGKVAWSYPHSSRDGWVLDEGKVLLALSNSKTYPNGAVVEVDRTGKVLFEFNGSQSEVNTVQLLDPNRILLTEAGAKPRILEVDRSGKVLAELPLQAQTKDHHLQTRMTRKLANGHYLVPQLLDRVVREYDSAGKVIWEVKTPHMPFTAIRLPDGHTLIGCTLGNLVVEVDEKGKEVWRVSNDDLPGKPINDACGVQRLENGNTVITSHHATASQVKLTEITRDKKIVWTYSDKRNAGIHHFQILDGDCRPLKINLR